MVKKTMQSHNEENCIYVKQESSSDVEEEKKEIPDDEFDYQFIPESNPIKSEIDIKWENVDFDVKNEKYLGNEDLSMVEDDKQHQQIIQHNLEDNFSFNTQSSSSSKVRNNN